MPRDLLNNLAALRIVEHADEEYIPLEETAKSKCNHHKLSDLACKQEHRQHNNCYYNYGINESSGRCHEWYYCHKSSSLPATGAVGPEEAGDDVLRSALRVPPEDIASQLTLLDLACFRSIRAEELATCGWTTAAKLAVAPNVVAFTQRFNRVSFWTVQEILNGQTPKLRAEIITHFIKVAKKLHELNNVHSLFAVISALQSASIYRLGKSWACLGKKDKQLLEKLTELFLDDDNWSTLRTYLKSVELPCIPYLGIFLTDLVYLDLAHPAGSPHRADKMAAVLRAALYFQASDYALAPLPRVTAYLSSVRYIEELQKFVEDDQFKLSQKLEPQSATASRAGSKESVKESGPASPFGLSPARRPAHGSFRLPAPAPAPAALHFHPTHRKCRSLGTKFRSASLPRNFHKDTLGGGDGGDGDGMFGICAAERGEDGAAAGAAVTVSLLDDGLLGAALHVGTGSDLALTLSGYQGLLKRKTIIKEGRKPALSSWQRYWVQIWTSSLIYFSPKSFKCSRRSEFRTEPCKVTPLAGWSVLHVDSAPADTFQLVDQLHSTLYKFKAESVESAKEWLTHIKEVSSQAAKPLPDNLLSFE